MTRIFRSALAASACVAALAAPAFAAPGKSMCGPPGQLRISGHGEARVSPDLVVISLGVTTQAETAGRAMQENSARQQSVLDMLTSAGVDQSDIQTEGVVLNPTMRYPDGGEPPSITGYMAQNMLTVRVTEIERIGEVLDSIVTAGANEMRGISFIREDSEAAEDDALRAAVADAQHRAEVISDASGLTLGPVMFMGEPRDSVIAPPPLAMRVMDSAADQAQAVPVQGGEVAFQSVIEVTYALRGGENCDRGKHRRKDHHPTGGSERSGEPTPMTPPAGNGARNGAAEQMPGSMTDPSRGGAGGTATVQTPAVDGHSDTAAPATPANAEPAAMPEAASPAADLAPAGAAPADAGPAGTAPAGAAPAETARPDTDPAKPAADDMAPSDPAKADPAAVDPGTDSSPSLSSGG